MVVCVLIEHYSTDRFIEAECVVVSYCVCHYNHPIMYHSVMCEIILCCFIAFVPTKELDTQPIF